MIGASQAIGGNRDRGLEAISLIDLDPSEPLQRGLQQPLLPQPLPPLQQSTPQLQPIHQYENLMRTNDPGPITRPLTSEPALFRKSLINC